MGQLVLQRHRDEQILIDVPASSGATRIVITQREHNWRLSRLAIEAPKNVKIVRPDAVYQDGPGGELQRQMGAVLDCIPDDEPEFRRQWEDAMNCADKPDAKRSRASSLLAHQMRHDSAEWRDWEKRCLQIWTGQTI